MPASAVDKYIFSFFVSVCSTDKDLLLLYCISSSQLVWSVCCVITCPVKTNYWSEVCSECCFLCSPRSLNLKWLLSVCELTKSKHTKKKGIYPHASRMVQCDWGFFRLISLEKWSVLSGVCLSRCYRCLLLNRQLSWKDTLSSFK